MAAAPEIVIVGGGVMGSATAYFLARDPAIACRVIVVERDPTYRFATSSLSASSIRQQFSTPVNIAMSLYGIEFLRDLERHLAVGDERLSIGLVEPGYLILASPQGEAILRDNVALQRSMGADIACLAPAEIASRFPWIALDGVAAAGYGVSGEGWFDGPALMRAFRRKAISLGARYLKDEVVGIARDKRAIHAVHLASGAQLACGQLVIAAGPHSGAVAALASLDLPVRPRKRSVFVFRTPERFERFPLLIDVSGAWCRPEGETYICGISPPEDQDRDATDFEVDHAMFEDQVWPILAARVPALETLKLVGSWAGHYEVNTLDHNAVIGSHPELGNLHFITGFSGHGMQHAPAAGRAIAELITAGRFVSLDLTQLGYARVRDLKPLRELNVI